MLKEQIESARKSLRQLKRSSAKGVLPEYGELVAARKAVKAATARLKLAEARWKSLGRKAKRKQPTRPRV